MNPLLIVLIILVAVWARLQALELRAAWYRVADMEREHAVVVRASEGYRQALADRSRELRNVSASRDQVMAALHVIQARLIEMRHEIRGQVADASSSEELRPH